MWLQIRLVLDVTCFGSDVRSTHNVGDFTSVKTQILSLVGFERRSCVCPSRLVVTSVVAIPISFESDLKWSKKTR